MKYTSLSFLILFGSTAGFTDTAPSFESGTSVPSNTAMSIRNIAFGPQTKPSPEALQSYIAELEDDIRNTDFRLQYLYFQCTSLAKLISMAKRHAEQRKQ